MQSASPTQQTIFGNSYTAPTPVYMLSNSSDSAYPRHKAHYYVMLPVRSNFIPQPLHLISIVEATWLVCQTTLFTNYFGCCIRDVTPIIAFLDSSWSFQLFCNLKFVTSPIFDRVMWLSNFLHVRWSRGCTWHFCHLTNANKNGQSHIKNDVVTIY